MPCCHCSFYIACNAATSCVKYPTGCNGKACDDVIQVKMENGGFKVTLLKRAVETKPVNQVMLSVDTTGKKLQLKLNIAENKVW